MIHLLPHGCIQKVLNHDSARACQCLPANRLRQNIPELPQRHTVAWVYWVRGEKLPSSVTVGMPSLLIGLRGAAGAIAPTSTTPLPPLSDVGLLCEKLLLRL